jgi:hypothetical protein
MSSSGILDKSSSSGSKFSSRSSDESTSSGSIISSGISGKSISSRSVFSSGTIFSIMFELVEASSFSLIDGLTAQPFSIYE